MILIDFISQALAYYKHEREERMVDYMTELINLLGIVLTGLTALLLLKDPEE